MWFTPTLRLKSLDKLIFSFAKKRERERKSVKVKVNCLVSILYKMYRLISNMVWKKTRINIYNCNHPLRDKKKV